MTAVSRAHPHHSYSHDGGRQADNPNWMSVLPDSVRLSELSIPGTHESLSFEGGVGVPRDMVKTQSMALEFQLESGIRVLDIRCAIVGNSFNIYHGNYYQNENFDGVLRKVVAFLKAHPRETVLMRVKEEKTNDPVEFERIFRETYWNNVNYKDHMWNVPTIPEISQNPTLGEMRGKIVILQDFAREQCNSPSSKAEFGLCYNSFAIQDAFYMRTNEGLYQKWIYVKNHLAAANSGDHPDTKYMNYLTASGGSFPYFVVSGHVSPGTGADRLATRHRTTDRNFWHDFPRLHCAGSHCTIFYEGTNTLVYGAIRTGYYTKRVGIIMTDFPGGGLIERIICINYPKTDPLCQRLPPCTGPKCANPE
jgi:1-phosphatidylinositol phosphodiesterase